MKLLSLSLWELPVSCLVVIVGGSFRHKAGLRASSEPLVVMLTVIAVPDLEGCWPNGARQQQQ